MPTARFLGSKRNLCSDFYEYPIHQSAARPGICSKTHQGGSRCRDMGVHGAGWDRCSPCPSSQR